jgi:hypothetical protein
MFVGRRVHARRCFGGRVADAHLAIMDSRGSAVEALTLGEAICKTMSAHISRQKADVGADLGRNQGRETALLDEAHLGG